MVSKDPLCSACSSRNCFINKYVNISGKKKIEKKKFFNSYRKGEIIIRQGDPVTGIYFIHTGKVKVYISSESDHVQIVRLADSGNILGHRGFGKSMVYPIGAATLDDSKICFLPTPVFLDALKLNSELTLNLLMLYADEMKRSEYKLFYSNQMNVKQRMAHTLLYLREVFGLYKKNGLTYLNVPISRKELAEIIGSSVEEVIRTLSLLNKEKVIKIDSKKIAITQPAALQELIAGFPVAGR